MRIGLGRRGSVALPRFGDNFLATAGFRIALVAILTGSDGGGSYLFATTSLGIAVIASLAGGNRSGLRRIYAVARRRINNLTLFASLKFLKNI